MDHEINVPEKFEFYRLERRVTRRRNRLLFPLIGINMAGWLYMVLIVEVINGLSLLFGLIMLASVIVLIVDIYRLEQAQNRWLSALHEEINDMMDGYKESYD